MAKIGLLKGSGKRLKIREKSVKSEGILKWILSGNPGKIMFIYLIILYYQVNQVIKLVIQILCQVRI